MLEIMKYIGLPLVGQSTYILPIAFWHTQPNVPVSSSTAHNLAHIVHLSGSIWSKTIVITEFNG